MPYTPEQQTILNQAHEEACISEQKFYWNPFLGAEVYTEYYLLDRGFCCGQGCQHCPYEDESVSINMETLLNKKSKPKQ